MSVQTIQRGACRRIACDGVAVDSAPARLLLVPWGHVESSSGDFEVDDQAAGAMVTAFSAQAVDIPIDYEHQTLGGKYARADGTAPAAGWIRGLEVVPGEGVFGAVDWTAAGKQMIAAREYRYLSPVILVSEADGRAIELHSAALTNKPAIVGMRPIVNRDGDSELARENRMLRTSLRAAYFQDAQKFYFGEQQRSAATPENGRRTVAASSGRAVSYTPATYTQSAENQRKDIIGKAAGEYVRNADGNMVVCSQRAWVDQALREADMPTLTTNEARDFGLNDEPQVSSRKPAFTRSVNAARAAVEHLPLADRRPAIIRKARDAFNANEQIQKVCSQRAWISNLLREASMGPLTENEIRAHSIRIDD